MIKLKDISTKAPKEFNKDETKKEHIALAQSIGEVSRIFEADKRFSLLVIFQGMDASGKDGSTRKTFSYVSPAVVSATSFKKPTTEEINHDFLWRVHKFAPEKGKIKVFNRSHYEDVLIQRVHKWIDEDTLKNRFDAINNFERLLAQDNNTKILKFYLHISQERQKQKLQERKDLLRKNWKHNPGDWEEALLWNDYRKAYEDVINKSEIPWHIIPADQKWYRNYMIAKTVLETMNEMNLRYPKLKEEA